MSLLTLHDINLDFGDQLIFDHADFTLDEGERVCLIGRNGAGKSTLFKIIMGAVIPDSGAVRRHGGAQVAQLEQTLPGNLDISVHDFVASGLATHIGLIERYRELTASALDDDGLREVEELHRSIEAHGGWDVESQIAAVITALELPDQRLLSELSGGWQRRVCLARALVSQPDVLLLDEPTNHLDLAAIEWLEKRIRAFKGSVLFITHDRAFLQALATRIVDIDRGQLKSWPGDYQRYLELKEAALEAESRHNALFDKKLAEEEAWIRQGIKARRTRNEGRVRALERMREEFAGRNRREGRAKIAVQEAERSSRRVVEARKISYAYGDTPVIKELSVKIMRGERIGMIGNNGVGKSTLLRLLLGQLEPNEGSIKFGEHLEIGYFDQLRQQLDPNKTVAEVVGDGRDHVIINGREVHVVGYLRGFLFSAKRAMTPVGFLSGGECNRVILAKLFTRPTNLMILDEPTNDLDVETLEVLEEQLADYQGTIIVVSHDRAFLDNVVTSTLVFEENGEVLRYPGGYSDWLRQGKRLAAKDEPLPSSVTAGKREAPAPKVAPAATSEAPKRAGKLSYKLQLELEQLPARIETMESEIAALENDSSAEDFYSRPFEQIQPVLDALAARREALDAAMMRWDELETMQREGG
ncbi:MAG: ATP-binding cassette domain-containing protein [Proteobacteria bacterium]|nr:ATP-binding cassette domain-containing protein [Pseudomonadota bacterium]